LRQQTPVLFAPHFVHGLVQVFGDMEPVVNDDGPPGELPRRGRELGTHVDGHRLDALALRGGQTAPQFERAGRVATCNHV
jgi:hypothetical protein